MGEFFQELCQKCNIPVQSTFWGKTILFEQKNFHQFWKLRQKIFDFSLFFPVRLPELHFVCPEEQFDKKNKNYLKKNYQFREMSINFPAFCSKHFSVDVRSAFQVRRGLFRGDTKLFAEKRFSIFEHWAQKCHWRLSYLFCGVVLTALKVSKATFWAGECPEYHSRWLTNKVSVYWQKNCQKKCRKGIVRVQKNILEELS